MEISAPKIDGKVCKTSSGSHKYGGTASSDGTEKHCGEGTTSSGVGDGQLKGFRAAVLELGKGWPGSGKASADHDDNAKKVSSDLVALNRDEKTIVAGLLAKTIEGGEVVEIRAVSSIFIGIRDELPSLLPS
ncbi:hypothetical protein ANAPH2_00907 [Anaplasma phagocytophilum]|nr:hypothetical protein ANAPH2_00907 [Anaplasma phagocytophilum]